MTPDGECVGVIAVCMEVRDGGKYSEVSVVCESGKQGERELTGCVVLRGRREGGLGGPFDSSRSKSASCSTRVVCLSTPKAIKGVCTLCSTCR